MGTFRCSVCALPVQFVDKISHVKSDWHIYNLKRVIVSLPPISEDIFCQKKTTLVNDVDETIQKKTYCDVCKKCFSNSASYNSHLSSKKHQNNEKNTRDLPKKLKKNKQNTTKVENLHENCTTLPFGSCLFCDRYFATDENQSENEKISDDVFAKRLLTHMYDAHQFSVPYPDKLTDSAGMIKELGRIIGQERSCLACGKQFYGSRLDSADGQRVSLAAVRNHMLDKDGHKQVWCGVDDPVELALQMAQSPDNDGNYSGVAGLAGGELFNQFYNGSTVISSFILPDNEDVYEVRLPSGTVLSHRKMSIVYKQNLAPYVTPNIVDLSRNAVGWHVDDSRRRQLVPSHAGSLLPRPLAKQVARVERQQFHDRNQWEMDMGVRGNLVNRSRLRKQC